MVRHDRSGCGDPSDFLAAVLQKFIPTFPSYVLVPTIGLGATATGIPDLLLRCVAATVGGAAGWYLLGTLIGPRIQRFVRRHGRWMLLSELRKAAKALGISMPRPSRDRPQGARELPEPGVALIVEPRQAVLGQPDSQLIVARSSLCAVLQGLRRKQNESRDHAKQRHKCSKGERLRELRGFIDRTKRQPQRRDADGEAGLAHDKRHRRGHARLR